MKLIPPRATNAALAQEPESIAEPPAAESAQFPSLIDRSLVRSVAWNAASDWGSQIFTWLAFLVVMRLLTPADFGIVALSAVLMPYLGQMTGMGIPRAVVQLRGLSDDQLAQLATVNITAGILCFAIGTFLAKPLAAFFRTPQLASVFIVACSGLIVGALCGVSAAVLTKNLRFRLLSVLGAATALIAAAATLVMAFLGLGYWALLLGSLLASMVRAAVILRIRPLRLAWPHFSEIREPLKFGWHASVSVLAMNSYQRLDNFIAGRMLGQSALGFYGTAWEFANVPIEKVTSLVTTVIPSYLAAVQDQPAALRRYLRGLTEVIALVTFPATVGLSLVAHELVPLVFGHKWDGMISPLRVLSFYAAFRSIVALLPKVLAAVGKVRYVMWNDLAALIILPIAFYIGSHRGTVGIAWGWVAAYPLVVLPLYRTTFQAIDMKVGEYFRALRPALNGTIAMIAAVQFVKYRLGPTERLLPRLVLEVAVGALVYLGILWFLHRDRLLVLIRSAENLRSRQTPLPGESSV